MVPPGGRGPGREMARAAAASGGGRGGPGPPPPPPPSHNGPAAASRAARPARALPLRPRRLGGALLSGLLYVPLCLFVEVPPRGSPRGPSLTGTCPWGSGYGNRIGSKSIFQNCPASDLCIPAGQSGSFGTRQRPTGFLLKSSRLLSNLNVSPGRLRARSARRFFGKGDGLWKRSESHSRGNWEGIDFGAMSGAQL